jgi:hypothetical protein
MCAVYYRSSVGVPTIDSATDSCTESFGFPLSMLCTGLSKYSRFMRWTNGTMPGKPSNKAVLSRVSGKL